MADSVKAILAIDLGTTRIKVARLGPDGTLTGIASVPAPALKGSGRIRESDTHEYSAAANT